MNIYEIKSMADTLSGNTYPGRGIIVGKTPDGTKAATAYFIMGRSANSRNRIFVEKKDAVFTEPFDVSKVEDPSLIIYTAIRAIGNNLIITNGNQTETVQKGLVTGMSFEEALSQRSFEPDAPNFTPRISALLTFDNDDFEYKMSILKSGDAEGTFCNRFGFQYVPKAGLGHFIHTYVCDGNPIPSFHGEPERIAIRNDIDEMTSEIWNSLDANNRISLYVRYINLSDGTITNRMINRNQEN